MKNKTELLQEQKILTNKLLRVNKQIQLSEVRKMQQLAGIIKEGEEKDNTQTPLKLKRNPDSSSDHIMYNIEEGGLFDGILFDKVGGNLIAGGEDLEREYNFNDFCEELDRRNINFKITEFGGNNSIEIPFNKKNFTF